MAKVDSTVSNMDKKNKDIMEAVDKVTVHKCKSKYCICFLIPEESSSEQAALPLWHCPVKVSLYSEPPCAGTLP